MASSAELVPSPAYDLLPKRPLRAGVPETYPFYTQDGVKLRLTRYQGGERGPVLLVHCIGVSSRMFRLDTVGTNLVEYLYEAGFDVWLLDMRPTAVGRVLKESGAKSLQVVAHGIGSQTFCMAMLGGLKGVRSAVCSQVAMHPKPAGLNRIKSRLGLPEMLNRLGIEAMSAPPQASTGWSDKALSLAARLHPVTPEEACHSLTCRRITAMYGPLYEHDMLNTATHDDLPHIFGEANVRSFAHLVRNLRAGHLVREDGTDCYMRHMSRLAIPLLLLHGGDNACLLPESTRISEEALVEWNGEDLYRRHVIPNYGHVDCIIGERAHRDVFPLIRSHLLETAA